MSSYNKTVGPFSIRDTGVPSQSPEKYATLVILHGHTWHGGIFSRLLPFADAYNARIILINRRDYPGSTPFDAQEHALLASAAAPDATANDAENVREFFKESTKEVYDCLYELCKSENLPDHSIILVGASESAAYTLSLLANGRAFFGTDETLLRRIRRIVAYNPTFRAFGYTPPADSYSPSTDRSIPVEAVTEHVQQWISGYYHHESSSTFEFRNAASEPLPTVSTMSPDEISASLHEPPSAPAGSDTLFLEAATKTGLLAAIRDYAFHPPRCTIELRFIWGDCAYWEVPFGMAAVQAEVAASLKAGTRRVRNITYAPIRGANAFMHWDEPERCLRALLADSPDRSL
ncbi:hypothetical protein BC834DRAFT_67872 [Gloeopeniophorella convolvens]|nr:hypothetical protein BC834DRAFT_67872 [Gloeopeniophorella convolvens]